jgi:hypothetical protein
MRFPDVSGLGLKRKVAECAFDREGGAVRLRNGKTGHLWDAERIHLQKCILRKQKAKQVHPIGMPEASLPVAGGQACEIPPVLCPPHSDPAGVQAARLPEESLPKRNLKQP